MKRILSLILCLTLFSFTVPAMAQTQSEVDKALQNIHKLDLLNQILPVLMKKDQIKAVLLEIEKARAAAKDIEKQEAKELTDVSSKVDKAVKDCEKTGKVPDDKLMDEMSALYKKFVDRRTAQHIKNVDNVLTAMKKNLNEGQIKAASNSLNPKIFNPNLDPASMSDDQKLVYWIDQVLLNPDAYDILVELSRN